MESGPRNSNYWSELKRSLEEDWTRRSARVMWKTIRTSVLAPPARDGHLKKSYKSVGSVKQVYSFPFLSCS